MRRPSGRNDKLGERRGRHPSGPFGTAPLEVRGNQGRRNDKLGEMDEVGKEKPGQLPARAFERRSKRKLSRETRRRFRRNLHAGGFHGAATAGLRKPGGRNRFWPADRHGYVFAFAGEIKVVLVAIPIDADEVAEMDLFGGQKIGHGVDDVALDGTLEVTRAVALVRALLQEEITALFGNAEKELAFGGFEDALLHHGQLDIENLFELFALERVENHDLVEAVQEFGGELAARRFDGGALDFLVKVGLGLVVGLDETVTAGHELGDVAATKVGGHKDDGLREVHAAIVAKGEGGFVQHAEEQLPEGVAGFFNFVEEQEGKFQLVAVGSRQGFLGD